jgi:methylated-DNA-[protein]-cysteine S-methyltransferase
MATEKGISQAIFCGDKSSKNEPLKSYPNSITNLCKQQLTEYFSGERQKFTVSLDPQGTPFQRSVWHCLSKIPFGQIRSYGEIAKMLENPKASQAVGGANGRNPITLMVPCHRVIGSNGALTGYAGGIERKLWLLKHEGADLKACNDHTLDDISNIINKRQAKTRFLQSASEISPRF